MNLEKRLLGLNLVVSAYPCPIMYVHIANTAVLVMRTQVRRGELCDVAGWKACSCVCTVHVSSLHVLLVLHRVKVVISCVSGCMHARDVLFGQVQVKSHNVELVAGERPWWLACCLHVSTLRDVA